jgi:hypothetical protein
MNSTMQRLLCTVLIAAAVAGIGHFTQWFGFTRPAIEKVRTEANARIDATNVNVAANTARIDLTEQKTAALEKASGEQAKQIEATNERVTQTAKDAAEASQATNANVAKLAERVDANAQAIGEMKAQIAAATPNAEEQQLQRDLMNAMSAASQLKAAFAEALQTEGRAPSSNAQIGLPAPERYADGSLTRIAIENGAVVAHFKASGATANPRFRLVPSGGADIGIVRWKCETNMLMAAKMFTACELKPSL